MANNNKFEEHKRRIRSFCHRATHTGGILLVAGVRGMGKTRLVDEALNERNEQGNSRRVEVQRQPRKAPRYLIKVDVDPFFPLTDLNKKSKVSKDAGDNQSDIKEDNEADNEPWTLNENKLAFILMSNIVFALTSAIDSRYSLRQYGKTLQERLGFWRYWFSGNGLKPCLSTPVPVIMLIIMAMALIVCTLASLTCFDNSLIDFLAYEYSGFNCFFLLFVFLFVIVWWMLLRWLDWRALANISKQLFDLVNAQEMTDTKDKKIKVSEEWEGKLPLIILFPLLIGFIALFVFGSVGDIEEKIGLIGEHNEIILAIFAAFGLAYVGKKIIETKTQDHVQYGQDNPVWMISLLRKYLFLCHRCGLEPVLVFDELDKLEELDEFWIESQNRHKLTSERAANPFAKSQPAQEMQSASAQKLNLFLVALARLKASLGAEFLWILISGPRLCEYLQQHRHNRLDGNLGMLATVIQQELVVGAADFETASKIAKERLDQQHRIEQLVENDLSQEQRCKEEKDELEKIAPILWLRSYGNLTTLVRRIETKDYFGLKPSTPAAIDAKTDSVASAVQAVWTVDLQKKIIDVSGDGDYEATLNLDWSQVWIHSGMLNIANRLLKESLAYRYFTDSLSAAVKEYCEKFGVPFKANRIQIEALLSGSPRLLQLLGEQMVFSYLAQIGKIDSFRSYDSGDVVRFK